MMTEDEWLSTAEPDSLLKWLQRSKRHRLPRRKVQLLAGAFADRCADRLAYPAAAEAREFVDRLAEDGLDLAAYLDVWRRLYRPLTRLEHGYILHWAIRVSDPTERAFSPETCARYVAGYVCQVLGEMERINQSALLRDIAGNPYHPVVFDPSWRTSTVAALAEQMYESRDFSPMPILADALQDAGCDNEDTLAHCRGPEAPHVRGCWVVDLVLGKS